MNGSARADKARLAKADVQDKRSPGAEGRNPAWRGFCHVLSTTIETYPGVESGVESIAWLSSCAVLPASLCSGLGSHFQNGRSADRDIPVNLIHVQIAGIEALHLLQVFRRPEFTAFERYSMIAFALKEVIPLRV